MQPATVQSASTVKSSRTHHNHRRKRSSTKSEKVAVTGRTRQRNGKQNGDNDRVENDEHRRKMKAIRVPSLDIESLDSLTIKSSTELITQMTDNEGKNEISSNAERTKSFTQLDNLKITSEAAKPWGLDTESTESTESGSLGKKSENDLEKESESDNILDGVSVSKLDSENKPEPSSDLESDVQDELQENKSLEELPDKDALSQRLVNLESTTEIFTPGDKDNWYQNKIQNRYIFRL